jgi:hypothetical protein
LTSPGLRGRPVASGEGHALNSEPATTDLERLGQLARALADSEPGPASELGCALADAVTGIAGRVDDLWRLIVTVVETAGISVPEAQSPPADFLQALAAPRSNQTRGVRLSIDGREWVAAISQDQPPADPAIAWAALERLTRAADDQEPGR